MSFLIGNRKVGSLEDPFVILEAGINHNGDIDIAKEMISVAKSVGADAVKFQTFKAEEFIADHKQMFTYTSQGKEVTESMLEMFKRYEFTKPEWQILKETCEELDITFMSTPQNPSDLNLLLEIGIPAIKIGSDDFTNLPLLKKYSEAKLPLIMSCGMADLGEIYDAVHLTGANSDKPVILMLCTSQYPTPPTDVNIRKLKTLKGAFPNIYLGFSDHTQGTTASILAAGYGAIAYEKHFTLDNDLPGPDHWFSENPSSAAIWINSIREAHEMLGSETLMPTTSELEMRTLARRSVTVIRPVSKGEAFSETNIGLSRPGDGLAPKFIDEFIGRQSRRDLEKGTQLTFTDIET